MGIKTERIEARVDPASATRIRHASELTHTSMSGFMVAAAAEKAEAVIAAHSHTLVPADYFDSLVAALDGPVEPMPKLEAVAARERERPTFTRS